MHADREIYVQTEIHSEQKHSKTLSVVYAYNVNLNTFPAIISPAFIHGREAEQLELFQISWLPFTSGSISVAEHHASEGGTQA